LKTKKPKSTIDKTRRNWIGPYVVMEKTGPQEYILASENGEIFSKRVHGRFMRPYVEGRKPNEYPRFSDKKGKNVSTKEIQEECRLALPKEQRLEYEDAIAEENEDEMKAEESMETINQEVLGEPYDSDEEFIDDPDDAKGLETIEEVDVITLQNEEFAQEILAEDEEEIVCYLLDGVVPEEEKSVEVTLIATNSEKQKQGSTLKHKAVIGKKYLSEYIEPLTSMIETEPNTIWKPMELYSCDGMYQYVRCMIIKAFCRNKFEAVGEIYVNAYQMNLAQPYMHLERDTFQLFDYEKTINRRKYENGLVSVELPGNKKLELIKRLQVGLTITSVEPFITYR